MKQKQWISVVLLRLAGLRSVRGSQMLFIGFSQSLWSVRSMSASPILDRKYQKTDSNIRPETEIVIFIIWIIKYVSQGNYNRHSVKKTTTTLK